MNKIQTMILALLLFPALFLSGCGSSSSTESNGSSIVTLKIASSGKTASISVTSATVLAKAEMRLRKALRASLAIAAGVPQGVNTIRTTVTAANMTTITRSIPVQVGQLDITDSFEVPNGLNRLFTVDALDIRGTSLYNGQATRDLKGTAVEIAFTMQATVLVNGFVFDNFSEAAIDGAIVTFGNNAPVTTNPKGNYFINLIPGTYSVTITAPGYIPAQLENVIVNQPTTGASVNINFFLSQLIL